MPEIMNKTHDGRTIWYANGTFFAISEKSVVSKHLSMITMVWDDDTDTMRTVYVPHKDVAPTIHAFSRFTVAPF